MPRQVRDAKIETRAARARLTAARKPYWRAIESGLHLGYRKPKSGSGQWVFRAWNGNSYEEKILARADDLANADGDVFLTFGQAQTRARATHLERERAALGCQVQRTGPYTVAAMMADYEADAIRRGKKAIGSIRSTTNAHILPELGNFEVARLTTERIRRWHAGIAEASKMVRSAKGTERRRREYDASDAEAVRRRRSTANRILTVFKAALNYAYAEGHVATDDAWRRVKPFRDVESARVRHLSAKEASTFLSACDPAFRPIASAALLTGCRYGELCRLKIGDINLAAGTLFVGESKSGKPRHVPLTQEGVDLFRQQISGRANTEHVFYRETFLRPGVGRGNKPAVRPWRSSEADRFMRSASKVAGLDRITFHELRHTYASLLVSEGVSLAFVAEVLGHADTRVTSRHYAHLAPSSVANAIRGALPRFDAVTASR